MTKVLGIRGESPVTAVHWSTGYTVHSAQCTVRTVHSTQYTVHSTHQDTRNSKKKLVTSLS